MNAVRRFFDFFLDSPTFGRDRARLISGFTIGTSAIALNAAILVMLVPLLQSPDDPGFQQMTDHVGFSQILALILLGGASMFATVLIPLRLTTVFFETRIGRYFDQIVLSGISPLRFLIGKVASQNLFIALFLFLLIPYLVFCITLGGVDFKFFLAGLFLIWLYCMALAFAMLWISLYMNEFLAAGVVIAVATTLSICGCIPMKFQPFVLTPFPVLIHPVQTSSPYLIDIVDRSYVPKFIACTIGMSLFIGMSLLAIYLGPLYGVIRENSTFGEVVRTGDSKRKRWFRFRPHIQRSSEIAFFYVNRGSWFVRHEGFIRWGTGFCGLVIMAAIAYAITLDEARKSLINWTANPVYLYDYARSFHALILSIHGTGLLLAMILFSHAKNTTYLKIPFLFGRKIEVSKLDTMAFLLFWLFSSTAAIAVPLNFEQYAAAPAGVSLFPVRQQTTPINPAGLTVDLFQALLETTIVISLVGIVLYAFHRALCQVMWIKSLSITLVGILYGVLVWMMPILFGSFALQGLPEVGKIPLLTILAPLFTAVSPMATVYMAFEGKMGGEFPDGMSKLPFYPFHVVLLLLALIQIRRQGRKLREQYMPELKREESHG